MLTVILFGLSPFFALILWAIIQRRISTATAVIIILLCLLVVSPLLFTKYYYSDLFEGFYSKYLINAIILAALLFIALNLLPVKKPIKVVILIVASLITLSDAGLTVYARGFVGDDKIFSTKKTEGYRIIYRREADA